MTITDGSALVLLLIFPSFFFNSFSYLALKSLEALLQRPALAKQAGEAGFAKP